MIRHYIGVAALACAASSAAGPASATEGAISKGSAIAAAFGAREQIQQISLSPDGGHVAIVAPLQARGAQLIIADLKSGAMRAVLTSSGDPDRLASCQWSTDTRLICQVAVIQKDGGDRLMFTRLISLDADGGKLKVLSARTNGDTRGLMQFGGDVIDWVGDGKGGTALMTRTFLPDDRTGSLVGSAGSGLGVEAVDTSSLERHTVERPRNGAVEYITDGHGSVRVMGVRPQSGDSGYTATRISYFYRKPGSRDWQPLSQVQDGTGAETGFDPYAVDRDLNVAYGFDNKDGRAALYKVALDGSGKRELVVARPDVDVDGLIRIGRQHRVVGVSWVTDKRQSEFFDPDLKKLGASLGRALPGAPLVNFVDASADEKKLLLFAGSDTDPGKYYVLDRTTHQMAEVLPSRPQLASQALASVKPVVFPAADGTSIPGYLTLPAGSDGKNLPAIVMPHGGPGARDEWGFDWLAQFFAARGYAVLQPNFRGSTGYGAAWFQTNGFQSWKVAIGDVNDAGRWLTRQGIAAPGKLGIVGWSYGGYAALQSAVLDPDLYKAIVAVAPVTDLEMLRTESASFTNYRSVDAFIGRGAHVRDGSPARNAERIKAPVLLFHGDMDRNVGIGESRLMADRLRGAGKRVELVEFKGLDHQLDDSSARAEMLDRADAFLRTSLGLAPGLGG